MLKIKDNVDLKELEKFGFEKDWFNCLGERRDYYGYGELVVYIDNREVHTFRMRMDTVIKFFDLVQAGLVEKVDE